MPPAPPPHFQKAKRRMRLGLLPAVMAATERSMRTRTGAPSRAIENRATEMSNQMKVAARARQISGQMQRVAARRTPMSGLAQQMAQGKMQQSMSNAKRDLLRRDLLRRQRRGRGV